MEGSRKSRAKSLARARTPFSLAEFGLDLKEQTVASDFVLMFIYRTSAFMEEKQERDHPMDSNLMPTKFSNKHVSMGYNPQ